MKKQNIMIEVSDEIYESVVTPYKKRKSFGKLVVQLLEAYAYNDVIYSYVNGTMDGLENEAMADLQQDLNKMAESLGMLGMLDSEAESVINNGERDFSAIREMNSGAGEVSTDIIQAQRNEVAVGLTKEDVIDIVKSETSDIKSMLQVIISGTGGVMIGTPVASEEKVVTREVIREVVKEEPKKEVKREERKEYAKVEEFESHNDVAPTEEEASAAQDALSSLMGSLSF